jgi:hypothetical protein
MMSQKATYGLAIISLVFGLITFTFPFILPTETVATLVHEDSVIEYMQALFFFLAALCFLGAFFISKTRNRLWKIQTPRNFIYLGLALILFFGAGEEISWGQRIFGFETPDSLEDVNIQGEVTLHNLPIFDPTSDSILKMDRLFSLFWFLLGIAIPVSAFYKPLRDFYNQIGMPIFPLVLGVQFLLFYVLSKAYVPLGMDNDLYNGRLPEFREVQIALIFFLCALYFFWRSRTGQDVQKTDAA